MVRVDFSVLAIADLANILSELTRDAGFRVAEKYRRDFDRLILTHLSVFPEMCQARPRLGAHICAGVVHPYLVVHRYNPSEPVVTIIRVLHGRRRITRVLVNTA